MVTGVRIVIGTPAFNDQLLGTASTEWTRQRLWRVLN
jgi:hypothetical protein